jgi:quinol monooxygenase YgiN
MANIKHAVQLKLGVSTEHLDSFLQRIRGEIFSELNDKEGLRRAYLLRSPEGDFNLLTFWNDKSAGDSYWASDHGRKSVESLRELLQSEPSLTEYAVELHEVNARELPLPETARESIRKASRAASSNSKKKGRSNLNRAARGKKKEKTKVRNDKSRRPKSRR